jgi:hypothetical protein
MHNFTCGHPDPQNQFRKMRGRPYSYREITNLDFQEPISSVPGKVVRLSLPELGKALCRKMAQMVNL